ncbi:uncharacterized protein BJ171DRAFT_424506 [Polychytrium aggregatum]|uniref:uncharacterized protein n=1 Tax=Polychytrium aggregatum TaxID=110093 RepID=UPI0022FE03CF|nr:uncharacterized protein BJ171DRAFT_424506 [Polychytrium aggregatum]KAI9204139.1 hypothetical protein BJ171DRAFT_424506 [Polychytrium aggregatum]
MAPSIVKLTPEQLSLFRRDFDLMDLDKDGKITPLELKTFMEALGETKDIPTEVDRIFKRMDINEDSVIDFDEFLIACQRKLRKDALRARFAVIDTDASGYISFEEAKAFFGFKQDNDLSEEDQEFLNAVFEVADVNHDGQISFSEFSRLDEQLEQLLEIEA